MKAADIAMKTRAKLEKKVLLILDVSKIYEEKRICLGFHEIFSHFYQEFGFNRLFKNRNLKL